MDDDGSRILINSNSCGISSEIFTGQLCRKGWGQSAAFTLAEVLITIAIIGVVAAMTIPTLMQNIQDREWATASDVFLKKLETSLKVMNVNDVLTGYSTTEDFANALQKYFKVSKICTNDKLQDCFSDTIFAGEDKTSKFSVSDMKTSGKMADAEWETNTVGIQFGNGVTGIMAYNPYCSANPHDANTNVMDCIALLYDVSGFQKPNALSKDIRATSNVNVSAMGNLCLAKVGGVCITKTAFQPTSVTQDECIQMAQSGKYGNFGTCDSLNVAAAVKACGGVDNVISESQMQDIVKAIYDCGENCEFDKRNTRINANYNYGEFSKLMSDGSSNVSVFIRSGYPVFNLGPNSYLLEGNLAYIRVICVGK